MNIKICEELTDDLDIMAEKMTKNELDVEAYQQWFGLICSALDLIKHKSKKVIKKILLIFFYTSLFLK